MADEQARSWSGTPVDEQAQDQRSQQKIGLAEPPAPEASALPAGTFEGACVLVTGGGTGLGRPIAVEFPKLGADIVIASRKPEHLDQGRETVGALGGQVLTVGCDIRDAEQ